jgi:hypothetical protein
MEKKALWDERHSKSLLSAPSGAGLTPAEIDRRLIILRSEARMYSELIWTTSQELSKFRDLRDKVQREITRLEKLTKPVTSPKSKSKRKQRKLTVSAEQEEKIRKFLARTPKPE